MTSLLMDAGIFLLLAISIGFGGIGIIGLFMFPDIRTRMYTATRASVISAGSMMLAGMLYALSTFLSGGGDGYLILFLDAVVILGIVIAANTLMYRRILKRLKTVHLCKVSQKPAGTEE